MRFNKPGGALLVWVATALWGGVALAQSAPAEPEEEPPPATAPADPAAAAPNEQAPPAVAPTEVAPAQPDREPAVRFLPEVQARTRGEVRLDPYQYDLGQPTRGSDNEAVLSRLRLGLTAEHDSLLIRASAQDVRRFGNAPLGTDDGSLTGLHEGYLQVGYDEAWLRLGRQEIVLGDQRLVGALDWSMAGRSFDGLRLHAVASIVTIDVVGSIVRMRREVTDDTGAVVDSSGDHFAGAYAAIAAHEAASVDVYLLYRHDGPSDEDLLRDRMVIAPGTRVYGKPHPRLSYGTELTYEGGSVSAMGVRRRQQALAASADVTGAVILPERLTATLGASFATGTDPSGDWTEFDNFYPTNHKFYGAADLIGLRNLREVHLKLGTKVLDDRLDGSLGGYLLALTEPAARWSDAGGRTLGQSALPGSALLGTELDATLRYALLAELFVEGGYALFLPAAGAERLGHSDPTQFLYLWVVAHLP